jgi:hypothetical protein
MLKIKQPNSDQPDLITQAQRRLAGMCVQCGATVQGDENWRNHTSGADCSKTLLQQALDDIIDRMSIGGYK